MTIHLIDPERTQTHTHGWTLCGELVPVKDLSAGVPPSPGRSARSEAMLRSSYVAATCANCTAVGIR